MMSNEASQPRNNDTVIFQQEYFDMSVEFYHVCKINYFIWKRQVSYLKKFAGMTKKPGILFIINNSCYLCIR